MSLMDSLTTYIKNIGIFIIVVQILGSFQNGNKYAPYVKLISELMILVMLLLPVMRFFSKNIWEDFSWSFVTGETAETSSFMPEENNASDSISLWEGHGMADMEAYSQNYIEQETMAKIKSRLNSIAKEENCYIVSMDIITTTNQRIAEEQELKLLLSEGKEEDVRQEITISKVKLKGDTVDDTSENVEKSSLLKQKFAEILGMQEESILIVWQERE